VKCALQKLSKYYTEVTLTTGMLLIPSHWLDPFRKVRSFRKWDKAMDIHAKDEPSYAIEYPEAFLKYVENEYCGNHRCLPVTNSEYTLFNSLNFFQLASRSSLLSDDPYGLSSDNDEYITPTNVAETTPRRSDGAARSLTAARLYLNSPPELQQNWGQINRNLNNDHSDPIEISGTFWVPDITDWWWQQDETHSKYADLSNVAHDIFCIIP
jgi:hypothetical protein